MFRSPKPAKPAFPRRFITASHYLADGALDLVEPLDVERLEGEGRREGVGEGHALLPPARAHDAAVGRAVRQVRVNEDEGLPRRLLGHGLQLGDDARAGDVLRCVCDAVRWWDWWR